MSDGNSNVTWKLLGGRVADGNHAKWGLTTPRSGHVNLANAYVIFGDLNMEGFPCSKQCNGSQAGRGGTFFSFLQPKLHKSLAEAVISKACSCSAELLRKSKRMMNETLQDPRLPAFEERRMCHRGCIKKINDRLAPDQLPTLSKNASSYWSE